MSPRPRGLAKLIGLLIKVCNVILAYRLVIRTFVPEGSRSAYDTALDAIIANCEIIRAIDYLDNNPSTDAPWGERNPDDNDA
jgi:hypothetical protein